MTRLDEIKARAEKAMAGEWGVGAELDVQAYVSDDEADVVAQCYDQDDATFIAAARDDVPWLVSEVERLRGLVRKVEANGKGEYDGRACPWCSSPVLYVKEDAEGNYVDIREDQVDHASDCHAFHPNGDVR